MSGPNPVDDNNDNSAQGTLSEIAVASLRKNLALGNITRHVIRGGFLEFVVMAHFDMQPSNIQFLTGTAASLIFDTASPVAKRIGMSSLMVGGGLITLIFDSIAEYDRVEALKKSVREDELWLEVWNSMTEEERQRARIANLREKSTIRMASRSLSSGRMQGALFV
ncbi:hypothetical protein EQ718_01805 [Paracoccus versutus]|uniref:hypothetical protein n=1 Tax=Paracoccus versutus TaxID=34007 RepID=UPI0011C0721C|nr:hypothetical protein [Paracoccus versutus]WEJ77696.1 hypothetical protein EQ718_01805 [Paracoccus versutus]